MEMKIDVLLFSRLDDAKLISYTGAKGLFDPFAESSMF